MRSRVNASQLSGLRGVLSELAPSARDTPKIRRVERGLPGIVGPVPPPLVI